MTKHRKKLLENLGFWYKIWSNSRPNFGLDDWIAFGLLIIGILGYVDGPIPYIPWWDEFYKGIRSELIGIGAAVLIITNAGEVVTKKQEKERLTLQMGSPDNAFAIEAVRQLRTKEWLFDGSLIGANLDGADLTGAILENANLTSASLRDVKLTDAYLEGAKLNNANLADADLTDTNLLWVDLTDICMLNVKLNNSLIVDTSFTDADLRNVDMIGANITRGNFIRATMTNANLARANFSNVDLSNVNLGGADLSDTSLSYTDMTGAKLFDVELISWRRTKDDFFKKLKDINGEPDEESDIEVDYESLARAKYTLKTSWPDGFDPVMEGARLVED